MVAAKKHSNLLITPQVLIEAALPTFMEEFENEEAWEETKEVKKRIATLSTGIVWPLLSHSVLVADY